MVEAGILAEHERVELVDGMLIRMVPTSNLHSRPLIDFNRELVVRFDGRADVGCQVGYWVDDTGTYLDFLVVELGSYRSDTPHARGQSFRLVESPDDVIDVDDIFRGPKTG